MLASEWVLLWDEVRLVRRFGELTVHRGVEYVAQRRVGRIQVDSDSYVRATVRGSRSFTYNTMIVGDRSGRLTTTCTCPIGGECKHIVALLVSLRQALLDQATPRWQQMLMPLVEPTATPEAITPLALQFNDNGYGITLRPLKLGKSGRWIKTGATWDDLRNSRDVDPDQHQVLLALEASRHQGGYSYGYRSDALALGELRPDVWRLLREAQSLGIEFVAGERVTRRPMGTPVLSDVANPSFTLDRVSDSAGSLILTPVLELESEFLPFNYRDLVGNPPHGVALHRGDELLLAPFPRPLTVEEARLFRVNEPISIPDDDVPVFATGFLPRLRSQLPVRVGQDVQLPQVRAPKLVCRVEFGDATASVHWMFRYEVGSDTRDLGLEAIPGEPPVRNPMAEQELVKSLPDGPWLTVLRDGERALRPVFLTGRPMFSFIDDALPALRERDDVVVEIGSEIPSYRKATEAPSVAFSVTDSVDDWFDLGIEVTIDGESVPFVALFTGLVRGDDHLLLESGTWFSLDHPELQRLRELIDEARALVDRDSGELKLRPEHAGLWEELVALGVVNEQSASWQRCVSALLDQDALPPVGVPDGLKANLRPYQQTGFEWLSFLWNTGLGGVLADEMGLGKTLQSLALAQHALESGELCEPILVVAPTSVLGTWVSEAKQFAPDLKVVPITQTQKRRGSSVADAVAGAHLVLTSYTLLRLEADQYRQIRWSGVLLDEAQFVKNRASKAYQAVRRLSARVKIALTGTPLENNLMDLWALLSITAPGLFADPAVFADLYRKPIEGGDQDALARLHRRIRPLVLRRTKTAVAKELPPKQEQVVPIELSPVHRRIYDKHLARERQKVLQLVGDLQTNRITILRSLTILRQLSLSPVLVDSEYPAASAKIDALVEMVAELVAEGHRALVFSQFTGFLRLVRDRLTAEGVSYEYLDGRTRDRTSRIDAFREGSAPVFLISLKAGGFGLTLTEADYVFILDPWWNPAAETQAIDRTHRIGQSQPVNVYRLVAADTIEEKVVALQQRKRDLFDSVVGAASDVAAPLSANDIRGLLEP